jgi:hypothetical protein
MILQMSFRIAVKVIHHLGKLRSSRYAPDQSPLSWDCLLEEG